jgi:hypothetical protein
MGCHIPELRQLDPPLDEPSALDHFHFSIAKYYSFYQTPTNKSMNLVITTSNLRTSYIYDSRR